MGEHLPGPAKTEGSLKDSAMITVRKSETLGTTESDGIIIKCHFSFSDYHDANYIHDGQLRVVNQIDLAPGQSYHLRHEENVDILTWVQSGKIFSETDFFPDETLGEADLHVLSTGEGCNNMTWTAGTTGASLIQIWMIPDCENAIREQTVRLSEISDRDGSFHILASGFPEDDPEDDVSIDDNSPATLRLQARLMISELPAGEAAEYITSSEREMYLLVISGSVAIANTTVMGGEAAAIHKMERLLVTAHEKTLMLLADIPSGAS
jgi:redox-sensitive bicupin YhaK (pirin superfamily)